MAKRFWTETTIDADAEGHFVRLDGRALKTPGKRPIRVPSAAIAASIRDEWDAVPLAVDGNIDPQVMPVTRLANVASEGAAERRGDLIAEVRSYAGTDLLCYRAPEPDSLTQRQDALWGPWLDWAAARDIQLETTRSLLPIAQPEASLDAVAEMARGHDTFALTLLTHLTAVYGSAILALAVMSHALDAGEAFDISRVDELHREAVWGVDEDAKAVRDALRAETVILGKLAKHI